MSVRSTAGHRRAPNGTFTGPAVRLGHDDNHAADTHTNRNVDQVGGRHEADVREERCYFRRLAANSGAILLRNNKRE